LVRSIVEDASALSLKRYLSMLWDAAQARALLKIKKII
jgi:hypothetical protein